MEEKVRSIAAELLRGGKVVGVLGLSGEHAQVGPRMFVKPEELESLSLSPRHSLAKTVVMLSQKGRRIGVIVRGCDERALIELAKLNQVNMADLEVIGFACSREQAIECGCPVPYPSNLAAGEKVEGAVDPLKTKLLAMTLDERDAFWKKELEKCQKCYGCRNACPICVCRTCELEQKMWVPKGALPPELPTFHLIKVFHLADKCTGCGECVAACPVDIPLKTLQLMLIDDMKELFEYHSGISEGPSPLLTSLEECPIRGEAHD